MEALYKLGKDVQRTTDVAKSFERRKCNHREAIPGNECITEVVGESYDVILISTVPSNRVLSSGESNKHRYVIATQSPALRSALRSVPAVPVVHINRSVMILEPPSDITLRAKELVGSYLTFKPLSLTRFCRLNIRLSYPPHPRKSRFQRCRKPQNHPKRNGRDPRDQTL